VKYLLLLLVVISQNIFGQQSNYIVEAPSYIKTFQVNNGKFPKPSNIIEFSHFVYASFDDIDADEKDYYYKIVRLDENWQPTQLQVSEYIDGFQSDIITDVVQSTGTLQSYTHYAVRFPNESTKILLSGNYIFQILNDDEEVVCSKPFVLYKKNIDVGIQVKWSNDVANRYKTQMIDFFLYKGDYSIMNETQSLKILLIQNDNWHSALQFSSPTFYQGNKWIYHQPQKALFNGLNEFRRFETKDLRGNNYNIVRRELTNDLYDFYLYTTSFRDHYLYYKDLDGAYVLSSEQAEDVSVEADYVNVHFSFDGEINNDEKLYVLGQFNDYTPSENNELKLNEQTGLYETSIRLKQGYYNYIYGIKTGNQMDYTITEGNFYQTENNYKLLVYYRAPGSRYAKIIGYGEVESSDLK